MRNANLKASVSRRWHFCLLIRQKPAHPVGSLESLGILQIGTSSSTRATQTSFGKQSSQYLVELRLDSIGLVTSASVSDINRVWLSGNDESLFKRIFGTKVLVAGESCGGFVDDVVVVVSFCCSALLFEDELLVEDFRYCWITCNFSGSVTNHFHVTTITSNIEDDWTKAKTNNHLQ